MDTDISEGREGGQR